MCFYKALLHVRAVWAVIVSADGMHASPAEWWHMSSAGASKSALVCVGKQDRLGCVVKALIRQLVCTISLQDIVILRVQRALLDAICSHQQACVCACSAVRLLLAADEAAELCYALMLGCVSPSANLTVTKQGTKGLN
jgi:hypothetical protein